MASIWCTLGLKRKFLFRIFACSQKLRAAYENDEHLRETLGENVPNQKYFRGMFLRKCMTRQGKIHAAALKKSLFCSIFYYNIFRSADTQNK
jgi:hypothetical protein